MKYYKRSCLDSIDVRVKFVFIEVHFFLVMSENTVLVQIPRLTTLVIDFMDLAKGESEVICYFLLLLLVEPCEEFVLVFQVLLKIIISILVIMKISAVLLEGTVLT